MPGDQGAPVASAWASVDPHTHTLVEYPPDVGAKLEAAFSAHQPTCEIVIHEMHYVVDFHTMTQRNTKGGSRRVLRRRTPIPAAQPPAPAVQPPVPAAQPPLPAAQPPVPAAQPPVPAAQPPLPAAQPPAPMQVPSPSPLPRFDETCTLEWVEVQGPPHRTLPPQDVRRLKHLLRQQPSGVVAANGLAFAGNSDHHHVFHFVRCLYTNLSDPSCTTMHSIRWRCKADPPSTVREGPPISFDSLRSLISDAAQVCNASPCYVCFKTHKSPHECLDTYITQCEKHLLQLGGLEWSVVQVAACSYFFRLFLHTLVDLQTVGRALIEEALKQIRTFVSVWDADVEEVYNPQASLARMPSLVAAQPAAAARLCDLFYIFRCFLALKSAELARVLPASDPLLVEARQLWSCSNQDVYSMARSVCTVAQQLQSRSSIPNGIGQLMQSRDNMVKALRGAADDALHSRALPLSRMLLALPTHCPLVDDKECVKTLGKLATKLKCLAQDLQNSSFDHCGGGKYCGYDSWQRSLCTYFEHEANLGAECVAAVYLYTLDWPQLYDMLNTALRENDKEKLNALNPLYDRLLEYFKHVPGRPLVVYRGQKHRSIETLSQRREFISSMFTSTTMDANIAYKRFLQGDNPGTFLVYMLSEGRYVAPFSFLPVEKEVLAPPGVQFRVLYRVPLGHLAILDQKFDVAMLKDCADTVHYLTPEARVNVSLEGSKCVTWAYRTVQQYFVEPLVQQKQPQAGTPIQLFDAVRGLLREDSPNTWMLLVGDAGMGKSSCGIQINSRVSAPETEKAFGYDCVLISLPSVGKAVFEVGAIEQHIFQRLGLETDTAAQAHLRMHHKLLVMLDSLDEVPLAQWPVNASLVDSFGRDRWAHLRVIVTCRGEHMRQHKINSVALIGDRGSVWSLLPFKKENIENFLQLYLPLEADTEARHQVTKAYRTLPGEYQTPLMLYLLVKGHEELEHVPEGALPDAFEVHTRGVRALIRSNIRHSHINGFDTDELQKALEEEALQWSVRLAVVMLHRGVWQSTLRELCCDVLTDRFSCPFQLSPDRMLLLAPLRLKDYGWDSPFDFRHKSIHEFLVATAILGMRHTCEDSELDFMVAQLDITEHKHIREFVVMGQQRCTPSATAIQPIRIRAGYHMQYSPAVLVSRVTLKLKSITLSAKNIDDDTLSQILCKHRPNNIEFVDIAKEKEIVNEVPEAGVSATQRGLVAEPPHLFKPANTSPQPPCNRDATQRGLSESVAEILRIAHGLQQEDKSTLTDASLKLIAQHCPQLTHLNVSCTGDKVTDASISLIVQHCPKLIYLNVSETAGRVSDASISLLAKCPNLIYLNVSWTAGKVSDASISLIAQHCANLQYLDVSCTSSGVSDTSVSLMAQHCPNLQYLDVSETYGRMTDASISLIAQHCANLQHLNVSRTAGKVSDASISLIGQYCPNLQHLDVSWTEGKVGDASISLVVKRCPNLRHLNVSRTKGSVSDASISLIAQYCPNLQHLDVSWTDGKVTDASIAVISPHCPNLRHVDVNGTSMLSWASISARLPSSTLTASTTAGQQAE